MYYVQEPDAAVSVLDEMDAWIICPFFLQGGRYTIGDIHYVADSDRYFLLFTESALIWWVYILFNELVSYRLIPAGETEFAKDAAFGYKSSNLREVHTFPCLGETI